MLQPNPHFQKNKKTIAFNLSCGHCKTLFATYQKLGKGNILKLYIDRIESSTVELNSPASLLQCPNCQQQLGVLRDEKNTNRKFYALSTGSVNKKKL